MKKQFTEKLREAVFAVAPVVGIVLVLCLTVVPTSAQFITAFLLGAGLLILGMIFFTLGADISMMRIGQTIGSHLTKSRNIPMIALVCFVLGVIITIAEPDLRVLAESVPIVETGVMIIAVAVGVAGQTFLSPVRDVCGGVRAGLVTADSQRLCCGGL